MKAIIGLIYLLIEVLSAISPEGFMIIFLLIIIIFAIVKVNSYIEKKNEIKRMNRIRYSSNKLTDEELNRFIENNSIDKFERIGYMAAFADRYPPRKNLVDKR